MAAVNPYISYEGNCEEAFDHYKSVFGGDFAGKMRWKDNKDCADWSDEDKEKIMHVALPIGNTVLMGSDSLPQMGGVERGNGFSVAIGSNDLGEAEKIFNGLADGGQATMPLQKMFWGATFGMLTDKFGISWMINCDEGGQQG
jgi:PhnB protein